MPPQFTGAGQVVESTIPRRPNVLSTFISAPIDGLNLIDPPPLLKPTEASVLDNYLIYDWGIRERGPMTNISSTGLPDGGSVVGMYGFGSVSISGVLCCSSTGRTYRFVNNAFGALSAAVSQWNHAFSFRGYIYQPMASGAVARYDLTADTWTGASFTLSGAASQWGFAYRNRCYFINAGTTTVEYGDVLNITGATVGSFDFGQVFQRGRVLLWGMSWSYNQGINNDELFVLGNDQGEVVIYSGSYPNSADWQFVARVDIPVPSGPVFGGSNIIPTVIKLGQDLIIVTSRGAISLSKLFAGRSEDAVYYNVSRNIGNILSGGGGDKSTYNPFLYFASTHSLYVQNYERGSWSRFTGLATGSHKITNVACNGTSGGALIYDPVQPLFTSYILVAVDDGNIYKIIEEDTSYAADTGATYTWATGYMDFGSAHQKQSQFLRLLGRDMAGVSVTNTCKIAADFNANNTLGQIAGPSDTVTTAVSNNQYVSQQLAPPGVGKYLSYVFSKGGSASSINEIAGFDAFYQEGGIL